ncbi:glycosyltransferase [Hyphomicrobium sp. CS1GBMeth3]|uniref:glycosyltransferase n=1 Tax=Hyphomicrobium sp. CS1GBMeth3 TaxID=1892845 RepID=UPI0009308598|nr:glycosyltransferase [Hyphomicrobium sp. CS1GBMeth3]
MRVAIQTLGTRGDVQPYIALARALMARGHEVQLCAPAQFEGLVSDHNVPFAPVPGEFLALLDKPEGKAAVAGSKGFGAGFKLLKHIRPLMRAVLDAEWEAMRGFEPDAIVYHPKSMASPSAAEKLGRPCILASPLPGFTPTSAFPVPLLPFRSLGPFNRASHQLAILGPRLLFGRMMRAWREASLGLRGAQGASPVGTVYAYSPHVLPVPKDWGPDVLVSGYWFLDGGDWTPPERLKRFLDDGPLPVYIGFGSMPGVDADRMSATMIETLRMSGKRGLLASGGGALRVGDMPQHIHLIEHAPHDKLLPHVAATIHHGGAGTTAASLRVGKPMTICPFFGDQPFWARRMHELGVAPPPLDRKNLSAAEVASAIASMDGEAMRERASALGAAIQKENGCSLAARFIERSCAPA